MRVIFKQSGFSMFILVVIIAVMIGLLMATAGTYYANLLGDTFRAKRGIGAQQAMADFGAMAETSHETFLQNGGACPGGTNQAPAGAPFCWPNANPNNTHCINHPFQSIQICLNSANAETMSVSFHDLSPSLSRWQRYKVAASGWLREKLESGIKNLGRMHKYVSFEAFAFEDSSTYRPVLTNPPTAALAAAPACGAGIAVNAEPQRTYCKRCTNTGGGANAPNLSCVMLQICLDTTPCGAANSNRWIRQRIGVIRKMPP